MTFKSVDDVDGNGFDDELSAIEIAYLAKNVRNFLGNNNRKVRDKNMLNLGILARMNPLK